MIRTKHSRHFPHGKVETPEAGQEIVRLERASKRFGDQRVLREIDLAFRHGETTVVIGCSGCGKSVLLKHIIGIMRPDSGRVLVFDRDITRADRAEREALRLNFGMLFQSAALFDSMDVTHNVGFLLYEHTDLSDAEIREIVRQKLELVGLHDVEDMMPEELSGGMKKRVALARAIAMDPHIILYDEPTTGLDPVTADTINDLILETQRRLQATSIVVTHDITSARKIADRMVMLHEGRIIIDDTPEGVQESPDPRVQGFIQGDARLAAPGTESGDPA